MFPFFSYNKEPSDPVLRAVRSMMEGHFRKKINSNSLYSSAHLIAIWGSKEFDNY